ncbi:FadR/GntR family transcriptional regulator [Desmospora profundinema]|uniref:FadR/GntR family transcriptional regulator n=1 Tax=Desmospora profundinema TaxID=1571184 RepID=UPI00286BFC78|nr:FadR/GntR family transcriptional regulator [Desmospora profundinema]
MAFRQIRRKKIYEEVAEEIKGMMERGELKPGDKLASVKELAESFDVGRSAVREALSALRAMGLLEMRQGEGTYVRPFDIHALSRPIASALLMSREQIMDLLEVRKVLEVGSAAICAGRREESDLAEMERALAEMEAALGQEELGEQADVHFHFAIARGTKNQILVDMMNTISDTMRQTMRESRRIWLYAEEAMAERLLRDHQSIYEAIRDRNSTLAQQRMLAHLVQVEEVLRRFGETESLKE